LLKRPWHRRGKKEYIMQETPKGLRLHIGLFGRRNAGKSSLMNALLGQDLSIVSATPGTTTDPVEKAFELIPLGPVVLIDTAGLDDVGALGALRRQKTQAVLERVDMALLVVPPDGLGALENDVLQQLQVRAIPCLVVFNQRDLAQPPAADLALLAAQGVASRVLSAACPSEIEDLKQALLTLAPAHPLGEPRLLGDLLSAGDLVVLVVPIDLSAPKGRLILPQVQAIRDVLDSDAQCLVVKQHQLDATLARCNPPPRLVVCDSQVVKEAAQQTPLSLPLTTFSILMSRFKGDMVRLAQGAGAIRALQPGDRVLIAESCSHHAQEDDIGRVKIPRWLAQFAGGVLQVEVVAGKDFPEDLSPYALVVQCGGCMVTRRQILYRQDLATQQGVPMTNYGMAISLVQGVLERTLACFPAALAAFQAQSGA
jgi:[FeFe] hydrogenase H-cluster maturation GTPase HydF